jgi:hypothetical protein
MEDRDRWPIVRGLGRIEVVDGPCDPQLSRALQRHQAPGRPRRERRGLRMRDRLGERELDHIVLARHPALERVGRLDADREDAAAHAAFSHPRNVQMPAGAAGGDAGVVGPGEGVVVAVEDCCHVSEPTSRTNLHSCSC